MKTRIVAILVLSALISCNNGIDVLSSSSVVDDLEEVVTEEWSPTERQLDMCQATFTEGGTYWQVWKPAYNDGVFFEIQSDSLSHTVWCAHGEDMYSWVPDGDEEDHILEGQTLTWRAYGPAIGKYVKVKTIVLQK